MAETPGRDRLRELLDALLDDGPRGLDAAAERASSSPFHFARQLSSAIGEPPMSTRRRVLLERAAWQLAQGGSVTGAAFDAGYGSVDGFSRAFQKAFGHPPSAVRPGTASWLPSPNGLHFHPPMNLWMTTAPADVEGGRDGDDPVALMVLHDVDDTDHLIELVATLDPAERERELAPGRAVLSWDGPEPSVAAVLDNLVWTKEVWFASIAGKVEPTRGGRSPDELRERHRRAGSRWVSIVAGIAARDGWSDRMIDALCDPPQSFVLSSVVAHVLEYSAHRRQIVRSMLRELRVPDVALDHGDPIEWLHRHHGPGPSSPVPPSTPLPEPPEEMSR